MDFRFAVRTLRKSTGFTLLAVFILALGIGANSAIFSVVNALLLQPLKYKDPERIVSVASFFEKTGRRGSVSAPDFHDWRAQTADVFEGMAYYFTNETSVQTPGGPQYARIAAFNGDFDHVIGVTPSLGRPFTSEEQAKGGSLAAMISHSFWQSAFAGNPKAIGQTIKAANQVFTIIGVMPAGHKFPGRTDVWFPSWIFGETTSRSAHNYTVVARLRPGISVAQAQAKMDSVAAALAKTYPQSNAEKGASVLRLQDQMVANIQATVWVLFGAVGVVMLIACTNVANLLLVRAASRSREIAIRAALGASRWRVVRQLVTESIVLAFAGGVVGLVFAAWGMDALVSLAPSNIPRLDEVRLDAWVLGFTLLASFVASVLFGVVPALQASRVDLNDALKQGGTRSVVSGGTGWARSSLAVVEVALSVMLVAGAGLFIRSFAALSSQNVGYRTEKLMVAETDVPALGLENSKKATAFYSKLLEGVRALPGTRSASAVSFMPGGPGRSNGGYWIEGGPGPEQLGMRSPQAAFNVITPGYFQTMSVALRAGRDFTESDVYDGPLVAIINKALAEQAFPGADPVGRKIRCGLDRMEWMTIVGIAENVRAWGPATPPTPEIYMPHHQHPSYARSMDVVIDTSGSPASIAPAIRRLVRELNPEVPVRFSSVEGALSEAVATPRFRTVLLSVFAGLALCLAIAGVYGVVAYLVTQRTPEIGVRIALGANAGDVMRLVISQGMRMTVLGLILGIAGALASARLLESLLFEVKPTDALTYGGVALMLCLATLAACAVPALRAARVDPVVALRQD